jgi:hypothetical protein
MRIYLKLFLKVRIHVDGLETIIQT